tara:strand:- start:150 stop:1121 length:972 start_codon:yes stop_codon:yes gene_type:complete
MLKSLTILYLLNLVASRPILLFPGLGGSRLIKGNVDIWPPKLNYYLFNYNEWSNDIIYNKNITTLNFGDKKSLDLKLNLPYLIRKNLFDDIMKQDNTYPIPYDFRLINDPIYLSEFYNKLETYIESFNEPIDCLTHSSGGLLLHYFLYNKTDDWKKNHIRSVVNVNVPFAGLIIKEIIKVTFHNLIIGKDVLRSLGGIIINFPNLNVIKPVLIVDGKETNFFEYFKLDNEYIKNSNMIESFSKPNNVNTIIVYTSDRNTPSIISINSKKIKIINGPGDGIVPLASLLFPKKWKQENLEFHHLANYEHSSILFSKELLSILDNI